MTGAVSLIHPSLIDDALRGEWRALADDLHTPNPYFAPWFLEPALRRLADETVKLCLVRDGAGRLIGLAPMAPGAGYAKLPLRYMGVWRHDHCFNGAPLIRAGAFAAAVSALLDWIDEQPGGARFLRFPEAPFDDADAAAFDDLCAARGRPCRRQRTHQRALLTRAHDFETHIATVYSGKKRKELRRQAKRFAELGKAEFADLPITDANVDAFIAMEKAGWKGAHADGFPVARSTDEQAFFREAMKGGAQAGAVSCFALTLDGAPVAMLFSLRSGAMLSAFKIAYDETYSAYSPGVRLLMEATRRMLEDGAVAEFDSCARAGHPVVDTLWPARRRIAQLNIPAARASDKALLGLAAGIENAIRPMRK